MNSKLVQHMKDSPTQLCTQVLCFNHILNHLDLCEAVKRSNKSLFKACKIQTARYSKFQLKVIITSMKKTDDFHKISVFFYPFPKKEITTLVIKNLAVLIYPLRERYFSLSRFLSAKCKFWNVFEMIYRNEKARKDQLLCLITRVRVFPSLTTMARYVILIFSLEQF